MIWQKLNEARRKLGLTEAQIARLLQVGLSTYKGWGTRGKVPDYIAASVEAHLLLSERNLAKLKRERGI
jgi:DNA-binding transcriptional regulator YiaG